MKILVTGATGHVGSEVVRQLSLRNANVRVLVRKTGTAFPEGVEVAVGDLLDPISVRSGRCGSSTFRSPSSDPTISFKMMRSSKTR